MHTKITHTTLFYSVPGFLNLGCWNQFQEVLGKVTYVVVKGKSNGGVLDCFLGVSKRGAEVEKGSKTLFYSSLAD